MRACTFRVFRKTDTLTLLRLFDSDGRLVGQRELPAADVERFVETVERGYRTISADLPKLGKQLYDWLDGPTERWLEAAFADAGGLAIHVDVAGRLRHLPWELLLGQGGYLCAHPHRPFTPVRHVSESRRPFDRANRPLRVLFMACSAEGVEPVLGFEAEEGKILAATSEQKIELVVEESGSLSGLYQRVQSFDRDHIDVFHLTGHADVTNGRPVFLMEDDLGFRHDATADEIAAAFSGRWPRLVFLSGCKTGQAVDQGNLPSLCEALVHAGASAVLGWALPVGDESASVAAAALYEQLAIGKPLDEAVARARQELVGSNALYWHLLRLYADATPLDSLVTPLLTPGRGTLRVREAAAEFLDAGRTVGVCPRDKFVGRRRAIQRCLRVLRSSEGHPDYAEGVLLHGMGGLGKSSLAARLCERMAGHRRLVWTGRIDEPELLRVLGDKVDSAEAIAILNEQGPTLTQRLRRLLRGPLVNEPALFVLDDFEHNLTLREGGAILDPEPLEILRALLGAIRETASRSRVIVTSRYAFPLPGPARLYEEGLESMRGSDLAKKCALLPAFQRLAGSGDDLRERALVLAAGNPRLLDRLDKILADAATDHEAILAAVEATTEEFREEILLGSLLGQQHPDCHRLLALLALYALPVDRSAVAAIAGTSALDPHLGRAVSLGLAEAGKDPVTAAPRYFVSRIVEPLLEGSVSAPERLEACRRSTRHLYQTLWLAGERASTEELLEIHRLALLAGERDIAVDVGDVVATALVNRARYREAVLLCKLTLSVADDYRILHTLARAEQVLGETADARRHYERVLMECRKVAPGVAEGVAREHAAILHNLAGLLAQQGEVKRALELWQQSLDLDEQIGNVRGKAATLHEMAGVNAQQGEVKRALELWQQSLDLSEQIGDVQGKAATLHQMAGVIAQQGEVKRALELWQQSLELKEQIGDVQGKAATLHNMAGVIAQQGEVKRALELWQQSLDLCEQIGDVRGKAATLANMAWAKRMQGNEEGSHESYLVAANLLASIRAWPDLTTVLGNLGTSDQPRATAFLVQAVWLSFRIGVPLDQALSLAAALVENLDPSSDAAPLVATAALFMVRVRGEGHPDQGELQKRGLALILECAAARGITQEQLGEWFAAERLNDPAFFLPALDRALLSIIGDEGWLFDRGLIPGRHT